MLKQALCIFAVAMVSYWILDKCVVYGVFRHVSNHVPGDCFQLSGIDGGSEDIQVLPNGLAFISSGLNFLDKRKDAIGRIYLFSFNDSKAAPVQLTIVGDEKYKTINPHGISIWSDPKTGNVYLYVINHTPEGEAVDKFKFDTAKKTLKHMKRIEKEVNFHLINDLAVVAEDQFYYTNCIYMHNILESLGNLHWGSVGFYDGKTANIVESGLLLPNGISLSKDKKILYLAHIGKQELRVYNRNSDNSLTFSQSVFLSSLPDNLDVDMETGDVWIGAHPVGWKAMRYMEDKDKYSSPSQVLRVRFQSTPSTFSNADVAEVYSDDGTQLSASTVAVRYKNRMLIGTLASRTLFCRLNYY